MAAPGGASAGGGGAVRLDAHILQRWGPSYVLESPRDLSVPGSAPVTWEASVFSDSGGRAFVASLEGAFAVVDVGGGSVSGFIRSSLGVRSLCATHDEGTVLFGSSAEVGDCAGLIAALDVESGAHLQLFHGHKAPCVSLGRSPGGDWFVSGSEDGLIRLWDPRSGSNSVGLVATGAVPVVAVEPSGQVIAAAGRGFGVGLFDVSVEGATSSSALFDVRKLTAGPFLRNDAAERRAPHSVRWSHMSFSPDGSLLALSSVAGASSTPSLLLLDAFSLEPVASLPATATAGSALAGPPARTVGTAFSADGGFLIIGASNSGTVRGADLRALTAAVKARSEAEDGAPDAAMPPLADPTPLLAAEVGGTEPDMCMHPAPVTHVAASASAAAFISLSANHAALWTVPASS